MELVDSWKQCPRRIAEYFVICGLPDEPKYYDYSKVITHGEEIIKPDKPVDFTAYYEPIIDIQLVSLRDKSETPYGYHAIRHSYSGRYKAAIKGRVGEEVYLCYRRGRERPPITNISMFTEVDGVALKPGAQKIEHTWDGKSAKLKSLPSTYLSYTRADPSSGIDQLAVIDICVIFPHKHETCPPAYIQLPESLTGNLLGGNAYLCFRKSLVKEHTIAYQPKVLFWYRVPPPVSFEDGGDSIDQPEEKCMDAPAACDSSSNSDDASLDPDIRQVAEFCLPWGAMIESWSVEQNIPDPNSFSFVLTNHLGERLYGVAFTFHEPYDIGKLDMDKCYRLGVDPELVSCGSTADPPVADLNPDEEAKITERQKHFVRSRVGDRVIGVTKALCLLSRWPFPVAFSNFLAFLYSRCYPGVNSDPVPLERYLTHFLCEVPFPDQNSPNILVALCAAPILLESPDDPRSSASCEPFFYLLNVLGVDLTINLFVHVLTEQKILLTSVHPFLLTQIGEALISMIFPLQWAVVYIPFIYMGHMQVIQSPSPYLIGVDSRFFDFFSLPSGNAGVTYVDLDTRNFRPADVPGQPVLETKLLPKKPLNLLRARLTELYKQIGVLKSRCTKARTTVLLRSLFTEPGTQLAHDQLEFLQRQADIGWQVKEAFERCMACLLRGYREFIIPVRKAECDQLFDGEKFLGRLGNDRSAPLYKLLFNTQHFVNFIRDRSYVSCRDEELANFDNLVDSLSDGRSLSASSLTNMDSLPLPMDGSLGDGSSQRGSVSEETFALRLLAQGQWNNESIRMIGPPSWPPSDPLWAAAAEANRTEVSGHKQSTRGFDLVPNRWNTSLLDQLSAYSYCIQMASSRDDDMAPESLLPPIGLLSPQRPSRLPHLGTALSASSNSLTSIRPGLRYAAFTDSPSPSVSRSVTTTPIGLTGMPTDYPLPIKNSSILRRSPLELRHSMESGKQLYQSHDLAWAKYLIGSMYSLWFMLLPSYLSSLYNQAMHSVHADAEAAVISLNACLTEAVAVATRLSAEKIECVDQVIHRILLVLLYQNRPPNVPLANFLDGVCWNETSTGLANHIYKAYEKECRDAERLKREQLPSQPPLTHRRSASACCMITDSIEPTVTGMATGIEMDHSSRVPVTADIAVPVPLTSNGVASTYKRSNSSTISSAQLNFPLATSETDSGLHLGTATEDPADDCVQGQNSLNPLPSESELAVPNSARLSGHSAPLASLDEDLTDLGYSTLHRPATNELDTSTDQSLDCNVAAALNLDLRRISDPLIQLPSIKTCPSPLIESPLEPVQKPSPSVWIERENPEIRLAPRESTEPDSSYLVTTASTNGPSTTVTTDDSDSASDSDSDRAVSPRRPSMDSPPAARIPRKFVSADHRESLDSLRESFSVPRDSFDQLTNALTSLGKSEITAKVINSVRDWLSPLNRSAANTPNPGRRASVAERILPSTPNSARLPRDMRRWQLRSTSNDSNVYAATRQMTLHSAEVDGLQTNFGTQLQELQNLWFKIAGGMAMGAPHQRFFTATTATRVMMPFMRSSFSPKATSPMASMENTLTSEQEPASPSSRTGSFDSNVTPLYVTITTCNSCPHCDQSIHDEEIMASWSCDEDGYHMQCAFCDSPFVPHLTVRVHAVVRNDGSASSAGAPVRSDSAHSLSESNSPSQGSGSSFKGLLEFKQQYLSPLTLRKTLETVIQREGDECLHSFNPKQSLLFRHPCLLWNLVWHTSRLGLPTHLLDHFPLWLIDQQSRVQLIVSATPSPVGSKQFTVSGSVPNAFKQIKLSPDLPVRISLRWNAFQAARSLLNRPLYKQWTHHKNECKSQWMLIAGRPNAAPILSPANLNLSASSQCKTESTLARVVELIQKFDVNAALDALVQYRASVLCNKPLSTLIRPSTDRIPVTGSPRPTESSPNCTRLPHDHRQPTQHAQCTDAHNRTAWCLDGSLYRELLFLTVTVLPPDLIDLVRFDQEYESAYRLFRSNGNSLVQATDCAPNAVASACRQMLCPLKLNP